MPFARRRTSFTPFPARLGDHGRGNRRRRLSIRVPKEFLDRVEAGEFLEHAERARPLLRDIAKLRCCANLKNGVDVLIDIDTQGAAAIRNCDDTFIRQALTDVFIMPPDLEELRRRLTKRGTETRSKSNCVSSTPRAKWNCGATTATQSSAIDGRRLAEVSAHHGSGTLSQPASLSDRNSRPNELAIEYPAVKTKTEATKNKSKCVVLGVTGSIAAYKSAELDQPARETRTRSFRRHDQGRDGIHYTADFANALQESGDDELLRRKRKLATGHISISLIAPTFSDRSRDCNIIAELAQASRVIRWPRSRSQLARPF